jgi:DNA-binding transcriptional regulator YhcF (GntR family)
MSIDCRNRAVEGAALPPGERVLTVDELALQFRVSGKTVRRWSR